MPHGGVILAASLGTGFEWYDFFLYGALAATISREFFAGVNQTSAFIFALLAFAAGFARDHHHHGHLDHTGRSPAELPVRWHRRPGHAHCTAHAAGSCHRR